MTTTPDTRPRRRGQRSATTVVLVIGGGALSAAAWIGGDPGIAVVLVIFYVIAATIAFVWAGGKGDIAAIMRNGGDERQRGIDRDANAVTGIVMAIVAVLGAIVATARDGSPGVFGFMCAVGGITYSVSLIALRRRR